MARKKGLAGQDLAEHLKKIVLRGIQINSPDDLIAQVLREDHGDRNWKPFIDSVRVERERRIFAST